MEEDQPLPDMIELYKNDVRQYPESHLDLPIKVAHKICAETPKLWGHLMDFIQEGNLELLRCIDVFNERKGTNEHFRNYAAACIRGVIYHYFARLPSIYIPATSRQKLIKNGYEEELNLLEYMISFEALYEHMIDIEEPTEILQEACYKTKYEQIQALLVRLSTREKQVIIMRYGIDGPEYTYDDIAAKCNIHSSHARLLVKQAIKRMNGTNTKSIREYRTFL